MIRVLNVYYPTRTVFLLLGEAIITVGCFLMATILVLGTDAYIALNYEYGLPKLDVLFSVMVI